MLDISKLNVPKCITCGTMPVITQKESMIQTAEDNYTEWKPSGAFVLMVECPKCGRFCKTFAMEQEHIDNDADILEKYGWTKKHFTFVGCQYEGDSEEDDARGYDACGCDDNEGICCEDCPHWGLAHCSNCGCSKFEFARRCTPEDDAQNYENKCMYKCAKCGEMMRAWLF